MVKVEGLVCYGDRAIFLFHYKPVANPFYRNDLQRRILFQVSPELGDVYVKGPRIKEGVAPPQYIQDILPVNNTFAVFVQQPQQFTFPERQFLFPGAVK